MNECKYELICPECFSDEVYYENPTTGSGKYTCQDCEFMSVSVDDFRYAIPAKDLADLRARMEIAEEALLKINDIRNSIVGLQTINWSEHIYPLVAALNDAGIQGLGYPKSQKKFGTMLERTIASESQVAVLRGIVEEISYQTTTYHFVTKPTKLALEAKAALSTTSAEASQKVQELEKYAELGRLVLEIIDSGFTEVCLSSNVMDLGCEDCGWQSFCRKRAKLLAKGSE